MEQLSDGRYKLKFYAWDVNGAEQIEAKSLVSSKKSARRLAHIWQMRFMKD